MDEARGAAVNGMTFASSAEDCLGRSDVAVIVNPLRELQAVDWSAARNTVVVDCWRCLVPEAVRIIRKYLPLGKGPDGAVPDWLRRTVGDDFDLLTD
jgi:hypothetical protein